LKKTKKSTNAFIAFLRIIPSLFKLAPILFILSILTSILHGVAYGATVIFNQKFFDSAALFAEKQQEVSVVIYALISLGLIQILKQILNGISNYIPIILKGVINRELTYKLNDKLGKIPPICFEDTKFLDAVNKAIKGKGEVVWTVATFIFIIAFYLPYFIFMSAYLLKLKPILVISILLVFIPILLTQIIRTKIFARLEDITAPLRRENNYYENCIVGREYLKETRLLGGFDFFIGLYKDTLKIINKLKFKADIKTNLIELSMKTFGLAGYIGIIFLLFDAIIKKEISVGAFAAVFQGINDVYKLMEQVFYSHIANMARDIGAIKNYIDFMELDEQKGMNIDIIKNSKIVADNITFTYPGSTTPAIENVSFSIEKNETVAIVGENGSGKSTLVRLITGLYLPENGSVLVGEHNTKEVSMGSLFKGVSAVFQKYQKYQMQLRQNICISEFDKECLDSSLDKSAEMAGFNASAKDFKKGYDTMLSREYGGVDLSGGQWQRIAIARGLYRKHDVIIMDEPTAAIDPIEETHIYNRFM
jgi:ATP-binding cassette subfamily B protein